MRMRPRCIIASKSPVHGLESTTLWLGALLVAVVAALATERDANAAMAMSSARLRETNGLAIVELQTEGLSVMAARGGMSSSRGECTPFRDLTMPFRSGFHAMRVCRRAHGVPPAVPRGAASMCG